MNKPIHTLLTVTVVLLLPLQVLAQSTSALSPEAEISFEKGVVAVGAQDWKLAIQYFLEAHEKNRDQNGRRRPAPPALRLNLGLAHAKAGEQFPAIAWLQAYLVSAPQAPNAGEVRKEIARLDASAEVQIRQVLELAVLSWKQVIDPERNSDFPPPTWLETLDVPVAYAFSGDIENARRIFDQFVPADERKHMSLSLPTERKQAMSVAYATHLGMSGDLERAKRAMQDVKDISEKDAAWGKIAGFWYHFYDPYRTFNMPLPALDFAAARNAAQEISNQDQRANRLAQISSDERDAKTFPEPLGMEPWVQASAALSGAERMRIFDLQETVLKIKSSNTSSNKEDDLFPNIRCLPYIAEDMCYVLQYLRMLQKTTQSVR